MAQCAYCKAKTEMYIGGDLPICIECSDAEESKRNLPPNPEVRATLFEELIAATTRAESARNAFAKATEESPSSRPDSEGIQHVINVSGELALAREKMMKAHNRLNDYLSRGIVPEDLEQSGR
jgi:chemotaxis protein histidine kinase CheA